MKIEELILIKGKIKSVAKVLILVVTIAINSELLILKYFK